MRCLYQKIFKVCLTIFQHYKWTFKVTPFGFDAIMSWWLRMSWCNSSSELCRSSKSGSESYSGIKTPPPPPWNIISIIFNLVFPIFFFGNLNYQVFLLVYTNPTAIYKFKVNNRKIKNIIKKYERRCWLRSSIFALNFEHVSDLSL